MARFTIIMMLFVSISINVFGFGKDGNVNGSVIDSKTNKPLQFVNVVVMKKSDSTVVTGATSSSDGKFEISSIPAGEYLLRCSIVGYKDRFSKPFIITEKQMLIQKDKIKMMPSAITLNSIEVKSERSVLTTGIDRKIYDVTQDVLSSSGSVSDLLQNIPSVQVDIEGNVSLRGSADVEILINGKNSALVDPTSRAEALQQIPANAIEKIEIISNPSAKFKPDGVSGIINIVLKKDTDLGYNGMVGANYGNLGRYNFNSSINYNPGGLNMFARYGIRQDKRASVNKDDRTQISLIDTTYYFGKRDAGGKPFSHLLAGGLDYNINSTNSTGVSGNFMFREYTRDESTQKTYYDGTHSKIEDYKRYRTGEEYQKEGEVNAYYQKNFDGDDHKVRLNYTYAFSPETENNYFKDSFSFPFGHPEGRDNMITIAKMFRNEVSLEYSKPLSDVSTFEAGYVGNFDKNDFDFKGELLADTLKTIFAVDTLKTKHFIASCAVHAAYATYSDSWGLFSYMAGLRLEQANVKSDLVSSNLIYTQDYFQAYPTIHMDYKLFSSAELQLNYSKRVNRPDDEDLNPFPEYQDPRNLRRGNPKLKPEYIHSFELGLKLETEVVTLSPILYYRNKVNGFTWVTSPLNDSVLVTTHENLSTDRSAGLEIAFIGSIAGVLNYNGGINGFYEKIDASDIGFSNSKSTYSWSGNLNCNFSTFANGIFQINTNYRAARLTPQGNFKPAFVLNIGYKQDIIPDKLTFTATASDILKTMKREMTVNTNWLQETMTDQRNSQVVYLGITYHFGATSKKSKEKSLQYDDSI